jgi:LPXTG-site transpeptidase (sortase) family protein
VAVLAIMGGLGIGAHIGWFYLRSATKGAALTRQFHHEVTKAQETHASCTALSDTAPGPQGLVAAPAIGLSAPVEAGDGDDVLNVAVGHVPGSVWPDEPGTTLLAAHDVSYFSQIDRLDVGQTVTFATPCVTYDYTVTGHMIVPDGSPLYTSPSQSLLVLETCYPLNALYITSEHYLVTAALRREVPRFTTEPAVLAVPPAPAVPAPAPLVAQGLTLDDNDVQLGLLDLAGTPSLSWQQSPAPLNDEAAALADYFAGLRSAEQDQAGWWAQLAPAVPFTDSQPLQGAQVTYDGSLTPTLDVVASKLAAADIDVDVDVNGGSDPGRYVLHVQETVIAGSLVITQWSMTSHT